MAYTHPLVEVTPEGSVQGVVKDLQTYFGRRPGDSLAQFSKELKGLSTDDKVQLCGGIRDGSLDYTVV